MAALTGTHKTRCIICGEKDDFVMRCGDNSMIDLCHICAEQGSKFANKNTIMFIKFYSLVYNIIHPGCHYGSEFGCDCIERFETLVWQGFFKDWVKKNRKIY